MLVRHWIPSPPVFSCIGICSPKPMVPRPQRIRRRRSRSLFKPFPFPLGQRDPNDLPVDAPPPPPPHPPLTRDPTSCSSDYGADPSAGVARPRRYARRSNSESGDASAYSSGDEPPVLGSSRGYRGVSRRSTSGDNRNYRTLAWTTSCRRDVTFVANYYPTPRD